MASIRQLVESIYQELKIFDHFKDDEDRYDQAESWLLAERPLVRKINWDDPDGQEKLEVLEKQQNNFNDFKDKVSNLPEPCSFEELKKIVDEHFDVNYPEWFEKEYYDGTVTNIKLPKDAFLFNEKGDKTINDVLSFEWQSDFNKCYKHEVYLGNFGRIIEKKGDELRASYNDWARLNLFDDNELCFQVDQIEFVDTVWNDMDNNDMSEWDYDEGFDDFMRCGTEKSCPFIREENILAASSDFVLIDKFEKLVEVAKESEDDEFDEWEDSDDFEDNDSNSQGGQ